MKPYLILIIEALCLFLLTCWSLGYLSREESVWMESVAFYTLAMFETKNRRVSISSLKIAFSLILGRILLELPPRVLEFHASRGSFFVTVSCMVAIVLGCIAGRRWPMYTYFIGTLILLYISNTWCIHVFDGWFINVVGPGEDFTKFL